MKIECNVVRDLIPLTLDGVASEESEKLVEEHITQCPPCATYRDGMKAALEESAKPTQDEAKAFGEAAVRMNKRRVIRIWRNVLLGVLLGAILMYAGGIGLRHFTIDNVRQIPNDEVKFTLSRLLDGKIVVTRALLVGYCNNSFQSDEIAKDESRVLYLTSKTSIIKNVDNDTLRYKPSACLLLQPDDFAKFTEIRVGTPENFETLYMKGDIVTAASEQMEAYFALENEYVREHGQMTVESSDGKVVTIDRAATRWLFMMEDDLQTAAENVPEWQIK